MGISPLYHWLGQEASIEAGPPACTFRGAPLGLIAVWLQSCERFAAAVTVRGSDGFIAKPLGSHVKGERLAMATPSGLKYEKTRNLQRKLEREVLSYLRGLDEPVPSVRLQAHFDIQRSEDINPVLQDLKAGYYIALDVRNNVTITQIGLSRLRAAMF
jgi:hypothetical protein